jgi:hypothetical protein
MDPLPSWRCLLACWRWAICMCGKTQGRALALLSSLRGACIGNQECARGMGAWA